MKLYDLRVDDVIIAGEGHSCLRAGERCIVHQTVDGELYVECDYGPHLICNNTDGDGIIDGFTLADSNKHD